MGILNDKDELMWHNAELVNRGEIITQGLRLVKSALKETLKRYPDTFHFGQVHFSVLVEIFEELGWKLEYWDSNGWEYDFWADIIVPEKDFNYSLSGSWYYPRYTLEKVKKNED